MFNAKAMDISGGTFNIINQCNHNGYQLLYQRIASGCMHDSAEQCSLPKIHPKTSLPILSDIVEWLNKPPNDTGASCVLWVNGPAGTGKTALAQSIAEICQRNGQLGASFFFPRNGVQSSQVASKIVLTLAYQLAVTLPEVGTDIGELVAGDPSILNKSLEIQLQRLIVGPMRSIHKQMVVIIDGLDACEGETTKRQIMGFLESNDISFIRFIVTSRNTSWIRDGFASDGLSQKAYEISTVRGLPEVREDAGGLLRNGFTRILMTLWRSNSMP